MGMIIKFRCSCDEDECDCHLIPQKVDYEQNEKDVYKYLKKLSVEIGERLKINKIKNGSK